MEKSRIRDKHPGSAILVSGVSDAGVPGVAGVPALVWLPTTLLASLLYLVYALLPMFLQFLTFLLSLEILLLLSSPFMCCNNEKTYRIRLSNYGTTPIGLVFFSVLGLLDNDQ